jgi:hypothetical protein
MNEDSKVATGGDVLGWLDAAITAATGKAEAAIAFGDGFHPGPDAATHVYGTGFGGPYLQVVVPGFDGQAEAAAEHFALYGPESVLRRCAADRKLLELHEPVPNHGRFSEPECPDDCDGQHNGPPVCMACRDYAGDPLNAPCLTVRLLAEGYGWTEGDR